MAGRCWSLWADRAVMPERPDDLCFRRCMSLLSSLMVMGGKERSRMLILQRGSGWKESEMIVMFVTSSIWSKSSSF